MMTQNCDVFLSHMSPARKEKRYWDGEKTVFVVLLGSSVALPCVNRRPLWREGLQEDQQQVAHWDFQPPGVRPDRADRLVDLYASGERRDYGPLFAQSKMSVAEDAFTLGDFSLTISNLKPVDKGLYSCHLHHHYCGLHERRIFRLTVGPPLPAAPTTVPRIFQNDVPEPSKPLRIKNIKRNYRKFVFPDASNGKCFSPYGFSAELRTTQLLGFLCYIYRHIWSVESVPPLANSLLRPLCFCVLS